MGNQGEARLLETRERGSRAPWEGAEGSPACKGDPPSTAEEDAGQQRSTAAMEERAVGREEEERAGKGASAGRGWERRRSPVSWRTWSLGQAPHGRSELRGAALERTRGPSWETGRKRSSTRVWRRGRALRTAVESSAGVHAMAEGATDHGELEPGPGRGGHGEQQEGGRAGRGNWRGGAGDPGRGAEDPSRGKLRAREEISTARKYPGREIATGGDEDGGRRRREGEKSPRERRLKIFFHFFNFFF